MQSTIEILQELIPKGRIEDSELIQELWSGYGTLKRFYLSNADFPSLVVKEVHAPRKTAHPRGWSTERSHQRKLRSYGIEANWYNLQSRQCGENCRVPRCYITKQDSTNSHFIIVLEDLDQAGFTERSTSISLEQIRSCITWLAHFHATFLGETPDSLWPTGTYWHLETRPDELEVLTDNRLKRAAPLIDNMLSSAKFQTLVHGDAKPANFCFTKEGGETAAVDFQYVGGGVGVKDLAYFIGSSLSGDDCERYEDELLDYYFSSLEAAVTEFKPQIDRDSLIEEWRSLFYTAWADFHRFLKGWNPEHWKLSKYSERITEMVLDNYQDESNRPKKS